MLLHADKYIYITLVQTKSITDNMDQDRSLDYEYYISDTDMEVDSTSRADRLKADKAI